MELRKQLAQLSMAAQVLEQTAASEKARRYLAIMDQGICRMLRIVGRLELSARLGDGAPVQLEYSLTDLAQLARGLGERLGRLLAAPEWMGALVDEGLIRQMLMELVSNAAKAGKQVTLTLTQYEQRAVFTVEDDGPGVDMEQLNRLFSSEEEAVPDWRRGGVGVAIARRVAGLHGGALVADCAPGRGLRVVASIPLGVPGGTVCETPALAWDQGGFDEELVALSDLLPPNVFGPQGGWREKNGSGDAS